MADPLFLLSFLLWVVAAIVALSGRWEALGRALLTLGTISGIIGAVVGRPIATNSIALPVRLAGEATRHHRVERRQERLDPFFRVNDLDDQRQVLVKAQNSPGPEPARMAEAYQPSESGAGLVPHLIRHLVYFGQQPPPVDER